MRRTADHAHGMSQRTRIAGGVHRPEALVCLLTTAALAHLAAADAHELTNADDVRAHRQQTQGKATPSSSDSTTTSTTTSASPSSSTPARALTPAQLAAQRAAEAAEERAAEAERARRAQFTMPSLLATVETGWYGMSIHSHTDASPGAGSLGAGYEVGYRIEPFRMTRVSANGRLGDWSMSGQGATSTDTAGRTGEMLAGTIAHVDLDDLGWWQGTVSWAKLTGEATTVDAAGAVHRSDVDSLWRTLSFERRVYPYWTWGAMYEDVAMPSAYSLDDPDGQVIAFFDPTTRWRTLSLTGGIDSSITNAVERQAGFHPLYELRGALGFGSMHYDASTVRSVAASYGYEVDDSDGFVCTVQGEAVLGCAGAVVWHGAMVECSVGARLHAAWYSTLTSHDDENTAGATYDTLVVNAETAMITYGAFVRLGVVY
jgi:hypothetical protein